MKRSRLLILFVALLFLSGCIDLERKITVSSDGSGTITERVLFSKAFYDMIASFGAMGDSTSEMSLIDEAELHKEAEAFGEGVAFERAEDLALGGRRGYEAVFSFPDIDKITVDVDPEDAAPGGGEAAAAGGKDQPSLKFEMERGDDPVLNIYLEDFLEEEEVEADTADIQFNDMGKITDEVLFFLKDLRVAVFIEVDDNEFTTNAEHVKGSRITLMELDFGRLLKSPGIKEQLKKSQPETMEDMKELFDNIDGFTLEQEKHIRIEF